MKMRYGHAYIPTATLLTILALASILLAPVAALSHHLQPESKAAVAASCDGCHDDDAGQNSKGDCCTSACSCACHAPLSIAAVAVPLPISFISIFAVFEPLETPQIYLPIFVPPQNRS